MATRMFDLFLSDPWLVAAEFSRVILVLSAGLLVVATSQARASRWLMIFAIMIAAPALIFALNPSRGAAPIPAISINFGTAAILIYFSLSHPRWGLSQTWREGDIQDLWRSRRRR